jgi:hypothetical protein
MNILQEKETLMRRINAIKEELNSLGLMRPGSLSKQYNICGNPTCRCKDKENPRKHGPYYQVSYTWRGKSTTQFIKEEKVEDVEEQLQNYKRFRDLTQEWVDVSVQIARLGRKKNKKKK